MREQDWTGALFVGAGESRFALRVGLLTKTGSVIREKMTNNLWRYSPLTPDGSYKQVEITTDDRKIMPAHLEALQEVISHPEWYSADEVDSATATLPGLQEKYDLIRTQERSIRVRYARTGDGSTVVGTVTALHDDTTVFFEATTPWGEPGEFGVDGSALTGRVPGLTDPASTGHFRLVPAEAPDSVASYASIDDMKAAMTGGTGAAGTVASVLTYHLAKGQTITFEAGVDGRPPAIDEPDIRAVQRILATAEAAGRTEFLTGSGAMGRAADAVRDAISLNTNYDKDNHCNYVMWGWGGGGGLFTGWDSAFDAITAGLVSTTLAHQHEADVYAAPAPPNQVPLLGPRYDQQNAGPMHAYAVWRLYCQHGDIDLVRSTYPTMVAFYDLLPEWDADGDGLLETPYFGERVGGRGNHLGLDDSPVYADYQKIEKVGGSGDSRANTNLSDVALNSYYALMADTLARLAGVLGKTADAQRFSADHAKLKRLLNEKLWNEERGMYLSRYLDGTWNEVVTPTVFYPLFGGIATPERAKILVEQHLLNPEEFWGDYVIPSIARNDPTFASGGPVHPESEHFKFFTKYNEESAPEQWKGSAWPPMNFTVYDGLKRYGFDDVAGQFATRSTTMFLDAWDSQGWFPESFDPEPGQSIMSSAVDSSWRTYTWGTAMALQSLHELISDNAWGDPAAIMFGSLSLPGTNSGKVVFRATGARVAVRNFLLGKSGATFDVTADDTAVIQVFPTGGKQRHIKVRKGSTHVQL